MSNTATATLTPFDTGEILEPMLHRDQSGKVDFDNDESATVVTVSARPTIGRDSVTVNIDTHGDDHVKVVVNDGTVFDESDETSDSEPTNTAYAVFGRYVAALLGSHEEWSGADMLEEIAEYASGLSEFPVIGGQGPDEYKLWRNVAGQLGIEHDGEDDEEDNQCRNDDCDDTTDDGEGYDGLCGNCADATTCSECGEGKSREATLCADCTPSVDDSNA